MKILFENANLIRESTLKNILIEDGLIQSVIDPSQIIHERDIQKIDLEGKVLLPGFVDIHMHLDKSFTYPTIHNKSGTLREAIQNYSDYQASVTFESLKKNMDKVIRNAIRHGTTALRTHLDGGSTEYVRHVVEAYLATKEKFSNYIYMEAVIMCPFNITKEIKEDIQWAISNGVELIGGAPHLSDNPQRNLETIFDIAVSEDIDIDLHVDESDSSEVNTLPAVCKLTNETKYNGRVIAGHCTSLSAMDTGKAHEILESVKESGIGIVTLPGANMYLLGRNDHGIIRRGLTRIKEMINFDIPVALGSDNIQDPFHPFGKADLLQMALLGSYGGQLTSEEHMIKLIDMISTIPARLMNMEHNLKVGQSADFVILNTRNQKLILSEQTPTREVWKNGKRVCKVTEVIEFDFPFHETN